ncbi:MAG TPA: methionine--tRNA ligase [Clostridia bacterium]|nr:methionine--tRNA ligase [Clostridia bacterium]
MSKEKFYITTAIAYTSKIPHIGNTYEAVLTDAIARYNRLLGKDVYFLTGTDEHGQKIQNQAEEEGITPQEHVDKIADEIRNIWDLMNVSYDQFIRTTDDKHKKIVQKIFKKLHDQGDIYKGKYEGHYCVPCESFFTESQLEEGNCPDCGRPVEQASEEAYFFKLSKYEDQLLEYIENNDFIVPESRKNEMVNNFIKDGLRDLCVSRTSFDWGIPVTIDDGHVIYVWIDALSNYITALGYDPAGNSDELYNKYWPADVHVIGKDIVRFHTIYWPVMLMALGEPLPKQVFGHPWLMLGDGKMSKSKGNVIYAKDLVEYFGVDPVRYFLLSEMPYDNDGVITYEIMINKINSDLANVLGNLVNRTLTMVEKYNDGIIPKPHEQNEIDLDLINMALETPKLVNNHMSTYKTGKALDEIFTFLRRTNKYIDETEPWILGKDVSEKERLDTVLYNLLESIRIASVLLEAFIPETSEAIQKQINAKAITFDSLKTFDGTVAFDKINEPSPLFARMDLEEKLEAIKAALESKEEIVEKSSELSDEKSNDESVGIVTFDEFIKVKMKVGEIISVEDHPNADKLYLVKVDLGSEVRQVVAGLKKHYSPEVLMNKKVVLVANLEPAKLRGEISEGMLLAAEKNNKVKLLTVDIENGAEIH